ncbi:MAG: SsrA-binding protein SmpB [Deltaproteobacteria bacterium]|nr:SsrA-binding protein SmpB [Deltaproteobacteria bacterium]
MSAKAPPPKSGEPHIQSVAKNRRATFDYHVEKRVECGIVLVGTEVKSLRAGACQLSDAYAVGQRGELMLLNAQIAHYAPAGPLSQHEPKRARKLLAHKREIESLLEKQQKAGYALVPLQVYFKDGRVKVELGLCRGKDGADKRDSIAEREAKREMDRAKKR